MFIVQGIRAHDYDQQTYDVENTQNSPKTFSHHQAVLIVESCVCLFQFFFTLLLTKLLA